jgi:hypothetical protein
MHHALACVSTLSNLRRLQIRHEPKVEWPTVFWRCICNRSMCDLLITYQRKARHKLVLVSGAASECEKRCAAVFNVDVETKN